MNVCNAAGDAVDGVCKDKLILLHIQHYLFDVQMA